MSQNWSFGRGKKARIAHHQPTAGASLLLLLDQRDDTQQQLGHWACDVCQQSFTTYAQAAWHEKTCLGPPPPPQPQPPRPQQQKESRELVKGGWLCDYCQEACFPTYEEAVEHEKVCVALHRGASPGPPRTIVCNLPT